MDILKDPETVKQLGSILKTNVRACKAVGHPFVIQLGRIYLDMLNVYKCLSENISAAIQTNGECCSLGNEITLCTFQSLSSQMGICFREIV